MDVLIKNMDMPKSCGICSVHYNEQLKMATDASRLKGKSRVIMRIFHVCPILRRDVTEYADNGEVCPDCPLVEFKKGKWVDRTDSDTNELFECSVCGEMYFLDGTPQAHKYHFCPNCGSRMEVEHE